jgi:hypothetical protein
MDTIDKKKGHKVMIDDQVLATAPNPHAEPAFSSASASAFTTSNHPSTLNIT